MKAAQGFFFENFMKKQYSVLLDKKTISSSIIRLAHEIYENNRELDDLVLIGIQTRGKP